MQGAAIYINIAAPCTTEIHTENQHFTLRVKPRVQPRFLHRLLILCFSCNPVIPKNKKSPKHFPFSVKIPIFASVPRAERSNAAKPAQLPNRYRLPNFLLFKSYLPTDYKKTIVFRKKIIAPLLVFSYMLYFYWLGLSMMRQSIALCICLYSMTYFFDAKYWQFLLLCLIAYLFHNSAFVFLGVGVMYWIKDIRFSFLINIAAILFLLTNSISILLYLSQTGLVKMELADLYINSGVDIPRTSLFLLFFCFGCLYVCKSKKEGEWDSVVKMLRLTLLYCLFFFIMSAFFEVAFRIAYYQMIVIMVLMPWIFRQSKKNNGRRICMSIYVLLFFYFYYVECQHGAVDTIPYKSIIVGI